MKTHLAQNKLHITELTILPQFAIVLMESALWVAGKLPEENNIFKWQLLYYPNKLHLSSTPSP